MTDLIHNLLHPLPNAVTTIIMGVVVLYWLFVFITGAGFDAFDFDLDFDADIDIPDASIPVADADINIPAHEGNANMGSEHGPGFFMKVLDFINVGKVPFMLVISIFKFFLWVGSLITTSLFNVAALGAWSLLILIPLAIIGIFFTKWTTNPLVKLFKEIGYKGEEAIDFLGRSGKMLSNIKDKKIGCVEIIVDKNPMKLNVISIDGSEINYGDYVIIADESDDKKIYYVSKEISIRNL